MSDSVIEDDTSDEGVVTTPNSDSEWDTSFDALTLGDGDINTGRFGAVGLKVGDFPAENSKNYLNQDERFPGKIDLIKEAVDFRKCKIILTKEVTTELITKIEEQNKEYIEARKAYMDKLDEIVTAFTEGKYGTLMDNKGCKAALIKTDGLTDAEGSNSQKLTEYISNRVQEAFASTEVIQSIVEGSGGVNGLSFLDLQSGEEGQKFKDKFVDEMIQTIKREVLGIFGAKQKENVKENLDDVTNHIKNIVSQCADSAWDGVELAFLNAKNKLEDGLLLDLNTGGSNGLSCVYIDNKGNRYGEGISAQEGGFFGLFKKNKNKTPSEESEESKKSEPTTEVFIETVNLKRKVVSIKIWKIVGGEKRSLDLYKGIMGRISKDWNIVPITNICVLSGESNGLFDNEKEAKNAASATRSDKVGRVGKKVSSAVKGIFDNTKGEKCRLTGEIRKRGKYNKEGVCEKFISEAPEEKNDEAQDEVLEGGAFTDSDNTSDLESVSEFDFYSDTSR